MRALYPRATVVILNQANHVLLIKYKRSDEWQLPGHWLNAETNPTNVLIPNVSQRLGLNIHHLEFKGVHSGTQAFHCVFTARAEGNPNPALGDVREAVWWDVQAPLDCQPHVAACIATAGYTYSPTPSLTQNDLRETTPNKWEPTGRTIGALIKGIVKQILGFQ